MEEVENYGLPEDPDDEEELLIVKKIFDMMEYAYLALAQFPRSEKQAIVADVKYDLLETIYLQEQIINKQNQIIAKLVNENIEKENFINEMIKEMQPEV